MSAGPLDGIRVLDFTTLLPGPLATLFLAEAGAKVTKIEQPGRGDEMRSYEIRLGSTSANFAMLNRGKRSLAIDLKDPETHARLCDLVVDADVLVEQFRPGVMDRLRLGWEDLSAINPALIYCSITGWGQSGPRALDASHDLNFVANSGLLDAIAGPALPHGLIADIGGGAYPAVINIALALIERERTGVGRHLDIVMADGALTWSYAGLGSGFGAGLWPARGEELLSGGSPRYRIYPTADGRHLAAAPLEDRFWARFCELIELPHELRDDDPDPAATTAAVAERIAARSAGDWERLFAGEDVCCNVIRSLEEAVEDPHFTSRGLFSATTGDGEGATMPALPLPLDPSLRVERPEAVAPRLGEHNDDLGFAGP